MKTVEVGDVDAVVHLEDEWVEERQETLVDVPQGVEEGDLSEDEVPVKVGERVLDKLGEDVPLEVRQALAVALEQGRTVLVGDKLAVKEEDDVPEGERV